MGILYRRWQWHQQQPCPCVVVWPRGEEAAAPRHQPIDGVAVRPGDGCARGERRLDLTLGLSEILRRLSCSGTLLLDSGEEHDTRAQCC